MDHRCHGRAREVPWIWEKLTLMDFGGGMVCGLFENVSPNEDCRSTLWRSVTGFEDMKTEGSSDEMLIKEVNINRSGSLVAWSTILKKDFDLISNGKGVSEYSVLISGFSISTHGHTTTTNTGSSGGLSDGYKNSISEKELPDETYKEYGVTLFRVQGSGPENMQAIQVEHVASSLSFSYCYILQNGSSIFMWIGYLTTPEV
ncbi:villin-4-like protein [Tanacetum coccineum]